MRDLVVITADADMQAVMKAVLNRPQSLGIRRVDHEVRRHDGRDSGLFHAGPEASRSLKGRFRYLLLLWDFHGSGQEHRAGATAESTADNVQSRLDAVTWKEISLATAMNPELEEWLWHNPVSVGKWLGQSGDTQLEAWMNDYSRQQEITVDAATRCRPKELLEFVCRKRWRRSPRVQDFDRIATAASLADWQNSPTFKSVVERLRIWFPPQPSVRVITP